MTASISAIQIWTLILAGLAVAASIGGTIYNAKTASASEHKVWQRDLRVRIYSECTAVAEEFVTLLTSFAANVHQSKRSQASHSKEVEQIRRVAELRIELMTKTDEVQTFGAKTVATSAVHLSKTVLQSSDNMVCDPVPDLDSMKVFLAPSGTALGQFRTAVRESLKMSDD